MPKTPRPSPGYPHGMLTVHADVINSDLLAFIKG
jgi:non-heme chloroperoxidase